MANIIDVLGKMIKPYKRTLFILFLVVLFIMVGVFCYNKFYVSKKENAKFSNVANANNSKKPVEIYFFFATWCPHCKNAMPEWKKFTEEYDGKEIDVYKIKCIQIDCTDDSDSKVASLINNFKIESYPTIKMVKDDNQIDFDAKVSKYNLEQFVHSVISS